jgi:hypothetical protein
MVFAPRSDVGIADLWTMMLGLGGLTIFSRPSARLWAWKLIVAASFVAGLSAVWFLALQVFAIGHLCMFCLIVHSCGLAAFVLVAMLRPTSSRWMWGSGGLALAAVGLLAFGQFASEPLPTYRIEETQRCPADESPSIFSPPDVFESRWWISGNFWMSTGPNEHDQMSWSLAQVVISIGADNNHGDAPCRKPFLALIEPNDSCRRPRRCTWCGKTRQFNQMKSITTMNRGWRVLSIKRLEEPPIWIHGIAVDWPRSCRISCH